MSLKPRVILLEQNLLNRFANRFRRVGADCLNGRILLLGDQADERTVQTVLLNRFFGFVEASSPPEHWVKAIRAVARGEVWLSRRNLIEAVWGLLAPPADDESGRPTRDTTPQSGTALTARENEIVQLVRLGWTNKEIARHLLIKEDTVKKHLLHVYEKLGVHCRTAMMLRVTED